MTSRLSIHTLLRSSHSIGIPLVRAAVSNLSGHIVLQQLSPLGSYCASLKRAKVTPHNELSIASSSGIASPLGLMRVFAPMSSCGVPWVASIAKSCIGVQACVVLLLWSDWMLIQSGQCISPLSLSLCSSSSYGAAAAEACP